MSIELIKINNSKNSELELNNTLEFSMIPHWNLITNSQYQLALSEYGPYPLALAGPQVSDITGERAMNSKRKTGFFLYIMKLSYQLKHDQQRHSPHVNRRRVKLLLAESKTYDISITGHILALCIIQCKPSLIVLSQKHSQQWYTLYVNCRRL